MPRECQRVSTGSSQAVDICEVFYDLILSKCLFLRPLIETQIVLESISYMICKVGDVNKLL